MYSQKPCNNGAFGVCIVQAYQQWKGFDMNDSLLNRVLEQIVKDVQVGDVTAIAELLADISDEAAIQFLPECEQ